MKNFKENKAITLVALVVTIIVLIILAGISINLLLGNEGILQKNREGRNNYQLAANEEKLRLAKLDYDAEKNSGSEEPKILVNKENIPNTRHEVIIGEDEYGNQVVVPDGFKVANDSGTNVREGIVIEDSEGNQYVWVPVSNINHDGNNKIKVNSLTEEGVEITLGRYTFDTSSPGNPTLAANSYQYASNYAKNVTIDKYYRELSLYRQSNGLKDLTGTNTTAKNLAGFVNSVKTNKGYYIARYEASYRTNGKAASKVSTKTRSAKSTPLTPGLLWNYIYQGEAAIACYDLYTTVNSDLTNSYAWDTAIVYIQAMGNTNYSNTTMARGGLTNTGRTGDEKCKIFDMSGNLSEWTTEYSNYVAYSTYNCPYVTRGCDYYSNSASRTKSRKYYNADGENSGYYNSFRPILYL